MKKLTRYLIVWVLILGAAAIFIFIRNQPKPAGERVMNVSEGTALVIPGAAARIAQEAALLEQLDEWGQLDRVVFISGVSSGALNAVMLNAILSGRYSWERYKSLLFSLNNQDVFSHTRSSLPVSTQPLRQLITALLHDSIGFYKMSDLPIPTSLSVVSLNLKNIASATYRLSNRRINPESDPDLDLVEVLMASTAFPVAFPPVSIHNAPTLPKGLFIDGGSASDYIPFRAVLEFEKASEVNVEKMIIICRKLDTEAGLRTELRELGVNRVDQVDKLGISLEEMGRKSFKNGLLALQKEAPSLAGRTFLYIPEIHKDYSLFDFHSLREQFEDTKQWAQSNQPVPFRTIVPENR
ncbi:MAG: patatin-like phospholipase family protein [Bacteroidota bacterium]